MKRKTNLFYTSGPDSKFITFSNYTESLTGNFLSTNTKLFPSRFICMYIDNLNNDSKALLIKYLASYYENKLAVLRDDCIDDDLNAEKYILPLNYLLEALCRVIVKKDNEDGTQTSILNLLNDTTLNVSEYSEISDTLDIQYISDITEQDYNGTYTDTICIVDLSKYKTGKLSFKTDYDISYDKFKTVDRTYDNLGIEGLYRWTTGMPFEYSGVSANYDVDIDSKSGTYYYGSNIENIELISGSSNSVKFNVIIPLFDLVNIDYKTNDVTIEEMSSIDLTNDVNGNLLYTKNVPLGMWFADKPVELTLDSTTGFSPTWSLLISSQFKPFPFSIDYSEVQDRDNYNTGFATFAQILSRQNQLIDKFNDVTTNIHSLNDRIVNIENQLRNIGTIDNIDSIRRELISYESELSGDLEKFKDQIFSYISNLKWSSVG